MVHVPTQRVMDGALNRFYQLYIGVSQLNGKEPTCHPFKAIPRLGWQTNGKQVSQVLKYSRDAYTKRCIQVGTATTFSAAHPLVQMYKMVPSLLSSLQPTMEETMRQWIEATKQWSDGKKAMDLLE